MDRENIELTELEDLERNKNSFLYYQDRIEKEIYSDDVDLTNNPYLSGDLMYFLMIINKMLK